MNTQTLYIAHGPHPYPTVVEMQTLPLQLHAHGKNFSGTKHFFVMSLPCCTAFLVPLRSFSATDQIPDFTRSQPHRLHSFPGMPRQQAGRHVCTYVRTHHARKCSKRHDPLGLAQARPSNIVVEFCLRHTFAAFLVYLGHSVQRWNLITLVLGIMLLPYTKWCREISRVCRLEYNYKCVAHIVIIGDKRVKFPCISYGKTDFIIPGAHEPLKAAKECSTHIR